MRRGNHNGGSTVYMVWKNLLFSSPITVSGYLNCESLIQGSAKLAVLKQLQNMDMMSTCNATVGSPTLADLCGTSQYLIFFSLLSDLVQSNEKISHSCERIKPIENPDDEYDFVVIGGGGAGSVVAARLSENPDWKILLLEAGIDEPPTAAVPGFNGYLIGTQLDWILSTTNESYGCLTAGGSCSMISGKMLGGSTAHNGMVYLRGNPKDFNDWAEAGNEGWTWEEVEPFFIKGEDNGEIDRVGRKHHGTGGPLSVERFPYLPSFGYAIFDASVEMGYNISEDLNGEQLTGFSRVQTTSKNGLRRSSATSYLRPARDRTNLHVSLNSYVTKVIVENDRAVGVEYYKNGETKTVRVSGEVVLSAGTIKSSHILQLSGIGPKEHLESVGIEVVKDLPGVGKNFHDHVAFSVSHTINEIEVWDNYDMAYQYLVNQTGPLSCNGLATVVGKFASKATSTDHPDIKLQINGYLDYCSGQVDELQNTGSRNVETHVVNLRSRSRGRVSLASNDPFEDPVIWGNYLSDPRDVDVLVQGIELGLELIDTEAMKAHNFTLTKTLIEACSNYTFPSTEYWTCAVRYPDASYLHQVGTCKMGPASDPMAVVDPQLRVYGIKGLRVVDNSIMPQVTSGNTGAPAMMIGERGADFIKKDWANKSGKSSSTCHKSK